LNILLFIWFFFYYHQTVFQIYRGLSMGWVKQLDIFTSTDSGLGLFTSTTARTSSTRHRPGSTRFDIDSDLLNSTSVHARTTQHRSGSKQFDVGLGSGDSTSARARKTRNWSKPRRLDIGPDRIDLDN